MPQLVEWAGVILGILGLAGLVIGTALLSLVAAIFVGSAIFVGVGALLIVLAVRSDTPPTKAEVDR